MKAFFNVSTLMLMVFMLAPSCTKDQVQEETAEHLLTEIKSVQQEIAANVFSIRNISEKDLSPNKAIAETHFQKLDPLVRRYEHLVHTLQHHGASNALEAQIRQNWQEVVAVESVKRGAAMYDFFGDPELPCLEQFREKRDELIEDFVAEFLFNMVGAFAEFVREYHEALKEFEDCLKEKYSVG